MTVYLFDLLCSVPYYNRYLCSALKKAGVDATVGSTSFHLDPGYFSRCGLRNDPGAVDIVGKLHIRRRWLRRLMKGIELCVNLIALAMRFALRPPDLLHVQWVAFDDLRLPVEIWFMRFMKRMGMRLVYTVHNILPHEQGGRLRESYRLLYQMVDAIICHTNEAKSRLVAEFGLRSERIFVIPHGPLFADYERPTVLEARRRLGISPGQFIALWQGLVRPYKGLDSLLCAWHKVHNYDPNARLVIAGSGEQRRLEDLERKVAALDLGGSVDLHLRYLAIEELIVFYQAADVLVYPYTEITQSGALLCGVGFGKPIVASALPGFQEILVHGESAILVGNADSDGLAEALFKLIEAPEERARLAQGVASTCAKSLSWERIACLTSACYSDVVAR